MNYKAVF